MLIISVVMVQERFCAGYRLDWGRPCHPSALQPWVGWGGCAAHGPRKPLPGWVGCPWGAGVAGSRASWGLCRGLGVGLPEHLLWGGVVAARWPRPPGSHLVWQEPRSGFWSPARQMPHEPVWQQHSSDRPSSRLSLRSPLWFYNS